MKKTFVSRYGSPNTRRAVEHESGECAACVFTGGVRDGAIIFVVVEHPDGEKEIRRIEGLGRIGVAGPLLNGCHSVTQEELDSEIALAHAEGRTPS